MAISTSCGPLCCGCPRNDIPEDNSPTILRDCYRAGAVANQCPTTQPGLNADEWKLSDAHSPDCRVLAAKGRGKNFDFAA